MRSSRGSRPSWRAPKGVIGDVVIAGDLNASPWSSALWPLTDVGFHDTRRGHGIHATWPAWFLPLRVPIDYVLASPSLVAWTHEVLPDIGSDHLAIAVELGWKDGHREGQR